jgi:mersacidin/lichenicidin family type 2 lantibiotic
MHLLQILKKGGKIMSLNHIIESWRDEEYRESLNAETRSLLPESPAGEVELSEADLAEVDGGTGITWTITITITITWTIAEK